jgi:hypothetical protein
MGMLNNSLFEYKNKPIEATQKNASLIKSYLFRKIGEEHPEFDGKNKINHLNNMKEKDMIGMVKKMPFSLEELEESINKNREEKEKMKNNNKKTVNLSNTTESSESDN